MTTDIACRHCGYHVHAPSCSRCTMEWESVPTIGASYTRIKRYCDNPHCEIKNGWCKASPKDTRTRDSAWRLCTEEELDRQSEAIRELSAANPDAKFGGLRFWTKE